MHFRMKSRIKIENQFFIYSIFNFNLADLVLLKFFCSQGLESVIDRQVLITSRMNAVVQCTTASEDNKTFLL